MERGEEALAGHGNGIGEFVGLKAHHSSFDDD